MKHHKNLLKLNDLAAFREYLTGPCGLECRDGKGEFEVLQVKIDKACWAPVNRNAQGQLSTHPELRPLIMGFYKTGKAAPRQDFKGEQAFKNFHQRLCERFGYTHDAADWWRDQASLEEHLAQLVAKPAPTKSNAFLEDLRDDFAMRAMQGWTANPLPKDWSIQEVAEWAYRQADAMLEARKK